MIHIRPALPSNSPALAKIQVDSYRTAYRGIFPDSYIAQFSYEEQAQDWRNLFDSNPEDILLVAESTDGQIIGYLLARAQPDIHPGYDSEIVALHVLKSHQRQGTGRLLLKKAVELLQQQRLPIRHVVDLESQSRPALVQKPGRQTDRRINASRWMTVRLRK